MELHILSGQIGAIALFRSETLANEKTYFIWCDALGPYGANGGTMTEIQRMRANAMRVDVAIIVVP
jgi:hypothetical protein